jgi:hypothetical protein
MDDTRKLSPKDWEDFFRKAKVRVEELEACKSKQSKAIKIGRFLTPNVGREVPIQVNGCAGKAVLRAEEGRSKEKRYYFVVTWDAKAAAASAGDTKLATKKQGKKSEQKAPKWKKKAASATPAANNARHEASKENPPGDGNPAKTKPSGNDEDW